MKGKTEAALDRAYDLGKAQGCEDALLWTLKTLLTYERWEHTPECMMVETYGLFVDVEAATDTVREKIQKGDYANQF